jgi:PPOX class probable F420-dependent enzyme
VILDPDTEKGAHALARLERSVAAWLTTVTPAGQPQSMPVWFVWTGTEVIVYGDHRARRNRNLEANPLVAFHLPDEGQGGDVVTFEATARIDPEYLPAGENAAYLAKYATSIDAAFGGPAKFSAIYSMPIRITLTRAVVFTG